MTQDRFWILLTKKLFEEATESELAELEALMLLYPELVNSATPIQKMWELPVKDNSEASKTAFFEHLIKMNEAGADVGFWLDEDHGKKPGKKTTFQTKKWIPFLAAACIIGVVSLLLFNGIFKKHTIQVAENLSELSTHNGSKSKLVLPDGSTVWLNAGSNLKYNKDFGIDSREITLDGEAFFEVVKMKEIPFVIHTGVIQIKVLGTAFNVKSYADEATTETSVVRGKVEVRVNKRPEEPFVLVPNSKLIVPNEMVVKAAKRIKSESKKIPLAILENLTYFERDSTIVETSWKENRLLFQSESFEDIAKKMERWYNVKIRFENEGLKKERMTGSFENETIMQALQALQISTSFHFKMEENNIIITN